MTTVPKKSHKTHHALQQQPAATQTHPDGEAVALFAIWSGMVSLGFVLVCAFVIWKIWMWIGKQRGKAFARGWQESMRR